MSDDPHQLVFDLPNRSALGLEDFLVSKSNMDALAIIDNWPDWPHQATILVGPSGSGKSHLANVWRMSSKAIIQPIEKIDDQWVREFEGHTPLVVEDIDRAPINEQAVFHLINLAKERGFHILFTMRAAPGDLTVSLPDLRSRLRAIPVVEIHPPDEVLLQILLIKLFDDRQLPISPAAIKYLARHMDQTTDMAVTIVDAVDRAAWQSAGQRVKRISRDMVAEALEAMSDDEG